MRYISQMSLLLQIRNFGKDTIRFKFSGIYTKIHVDSNSAFWKTPPKDCGTFSVPIRHVSQVVSLLVDTYLICISYRYYAKDSLVADQDFGPILSSLLVGPCALEFSKVKSCGQLWWAISYINVHYYSLYINWLFPFWLGLTYQPMNLCNVIKLPAVVLALHLVVLR